MNPFMWRSKQQEKEIGFSHVVVKKKSEAKKLKRKEIKKGIASETRQEEFLLSRGFLVGNERGRRPLNNEQ